MGHLSEGKLLLSHDRAGSVSGRQVVRRAAGSAVTDGEHGRNASCSGGGGLRSSKQSTAIAAGRLLERDRASRNGVCAARLASEPAAPT